MPEASLQVWFKKPSAVLTLRRQDPPRRPHRKRRYAFVVRHTAPQDPVDRAEARRQIREELEAERAEKAALGPSFCGKYWHNGRWSAKREARMLQKLFGEGLDPRRNEADNEDDI
jgi:hypothetical protein